MFQNKSCVFTAVITPNSETVGAIEAIVEGRKLTYPPPFPSFADRQKMGLQIAFSEESFPLDSATYLLPVICFFTTEKPPIDCEMMHTLLSANILCENMRVIPQEDLEALIGASVTGELEGDVASCKVGKSL